jgi:uncharacterized membrane protein
MTKTIRPILRTIFGLFFVGAAWGLIVLLVAVFLANLEMALHPHKFPEWSGPVLWTRLPLQGGLIAWAACYARNRAI